MTETVIVIAMRSAYIRHIDNVGTKRIRKMTNAAVGAACAEARRQGATPISMVDDLSIAKIGRWIGAFARCLTRSARREGVSVVGGEMAQMPDTYAAGYVGLTVTVVARAPGPGRSSQ
jgi:phosphoribosylaminoimidazole (AIR) synthetase